MNEQPPTIERDHDDGRIIVIDGALLAAIVGEDEGGQ